MPYHNFDFLVIGSGIAGLTFALKAAEKGSVGIITKKEIMEANTAYAQGGIAGVFNTEQDSFEKHIEDTLEAGAGLCNRKAVECIVRNAPRLIEELIKMGAEFTRKEGELHLGREGGHSENRIVHAADATGWEIERALVSKVRNHPNIEVFEHHFALDLLTEHHLGKDVKLDDPITCYGAYVLDEKEEAVHRMLSKVTVLAAGGAGQVYLHSTNPAVATGDGIAMAYRAKARIENMEFVQFHPTSLAIPEADSFLISEAVRGYGGILKNADGEAFMKQYDAREELAPRDIVARAIDDQLKKSGAKSVFLDITHKDAEKTKKAFPTIYETCLSYGLDITKKPIPVVPAAHYTCGGVATDLDGASSINRLFVCGENACTGVHGANRLASNSLLESLVFADRAAEKAVQLVDDFQINDKIPEWDASGTVNTEEWILVSHNKQEVQQVMWDYVGIVRSDLRLERAMRRINMLNEEVEDFYQRTRVSVPLCELRNLISVAHIIVQSAMQRKESRGLHYTTDYPEPADEKITTTIE
ncbi:L-aspartate oxidase [Aliifodinibius sp. S!AR15-10]|uniref:L-aspartate oxidase n=1 Tax=Aliifodinibius sp. S!AR15-10 TaxID=2950437 RepID=UPI002864766D|nr:L-aspartate oxidase [Aliifodinibius sp. S!AR15-10]MDR8390948.1 L-aspartate oxidase [Aliifodinibius sp. S!AR15-10]